jgi:site-specific recombinase XerD
MPVIPSAELSPQLRGSVTAWYRQGADVQRLLPILSTYLGHSDLEGTKVYLSMTPELLQQASLRFARYAGGGENV